ncbi:MAG: MoaD/ThiS family protein [Chloroflexi bacterium]|nr:MoaD/ThiS family protein [Chloroflexota bacterium]
MVTLTFRKQSWEVRPGMTIDAALRKIGIDPEAVLPTIKDTLVTMDYILKDGEVVKLVAVASGGS